MIMSLKHRKRKYEPRVKLKHNTNNKFEFLDGGI